jgi:hypothetical protein
MVGRVVAPWPRAPPPPPACPGAAAAGPPAAPPAAAASLCSDCGCGGGGCPGATTTAAAAPPGPRPGYSWVDASGVLLVQGPPAAAPPPPAPPRPLPPAAAEFASLAPAARSMRIWARISPGMLPGTSATPESTNQAAYRGDVGAAPDFTHHLRKTDFSE